MRTSSLAALAAFVTTVTAVPVSDLNKRYTGPNGQTQNTSAGGTGPNPNVSGDGGNGLTVSDSNLFMYCPLTLLDSQVTVIDPMGNTTIDKPAYRAITDFDYASFNLALHQEWIELVRPIDDSHDSVLPSCIGSVQLRIEAIQCC